MAAAAATTMVAALGTAVGGGHAVAAAAPTPGCTPYTGDTADLAGDAVNGLTTTSGTSPDAFTGTVLGTIDDGIAPGVDMIMARLSSPEIDRVGIWAGMSGSPVYTADGQLLGAVAYGLSFGPSTVAGITPASEMFKLTAQPLGRATPDQATPVAIPSTLQRRLVTAGASSARAADEGLRALRTPVAVSGKVTGARAEKIKKALGLPNVKIVQAARAPATPGEAAAMVAGGNLAVSLTYGDVSATGIGTVTAVCDGQVVGFGHPMTYAGPTSLTMQSADAIYIQEDPVFGGFKVANPTGPVGTIDQDRLTGVAGPLGPVPATATVTSTVRSDRDGDGTIGDETTGETRTGTTYVSSPDYLAFATLLAQLFNQDRVFDRVAPGTSKTHYTIAGDSTEAGPFVLHRKNRFESDYDISWQTSYAAAEDVYRVQENNFTDVDISDVAVTTRMSPEQRVFTVKSVEQRKHGSWVKLPRYSDIRAERGQTLRFRVNLDSYRGHFGTLTKRMDVVVPKHARRGSGSLQIAGGSSLYNRVRAGSFTQLLDNLAAAPRNNDLVAQLMLRQSNGPRLTKTTTKRLHDVVRGGRYYSLRIGRSGGDGGVVACRTSARGC